LVLPDNENEGKKAEGRFSLSRFSKRILVFLILVIGTAAVLRPIQLTLREEMGKARDVFIGNAEEFLGLKIKYGSLGPSIFGVVDIRNVLILRKDDSVLLSIDRLRLSYSLSAILRGVRIDAFHSVRIDRPVLSLDFKKDAGLWERLSSLRGKESSQAVERLLPENFSCRIWNGESDFADSIGSLMTRGVRVDASVKRNRISFQGRWNAQILLTSVSSEFFDSASFSSVEAVINGRISGEYSGDLNEGSATVEIPSITGNIFRLRPVSFGFFLSGNQFEIRKIYDKFPAAISLVYNLENKNINGRLEAENLALRDFLTFTGDYRKYNSALALRVSGHMNLETGMADIERENSDSFRLSVNFSGSGGENIFLEKANLEMAVTGNKDRITIDTFDFTSSSGELEFKGGVDFKNAGFNRLAPYGFLSLSDFRLHGDRGISGDFFLNTIGQDINLFTENLTAGKAKLAALDLSLHQAEDGISFALSAFNFGNTGIDTGNDSGYEDDFSVSTIFINGSADYEPRQIQANVRLDSFSMGDILSFVEPLAPLSAIPSVVRFAADNLSVTTEIFFITDYTHVLYNAPRIVAAYEGLREVLAAASFSGTDRGMELSSARVTWNNVTAEFNGYADFSDPNDILFSFGASLRNLTYSFEGMIQDQKNITIRGSYGIQATLVADEFGFRTGYARGDLVPFPSGSNFASLSFLFSFSYDSPEYWRTRIERFEISSLTTPSSSAALVRFTGEAGERGLRIPDFFFDDDHGALSGDIVVNWDTAYKNFFFRTDIASSNRSEFYALEGAYSDNLLSLVLSGQGMRFSRFSNLNASADGNLRLQWKSPADFELEMTLPSFAMRWQDELIRVSAQMSANNDELLARRIRVNFSGLEVSMPFVRIDRAAARAETEAEIWGTLSERPLDIFFSGDARFSPAENWVDLYKNFKFLNALLTVESAYYSDIVADNPFSFSFDCRQESSGYAMSLNGGPKEMLRFRYSPERGGGGVFYAALSAPSPVRGTLAGFVNINSNSIDAQGSDLYVDLGSLSRFIIPPDSAVEFPGGIITASIRVAGTLEDPEFYGTARGTSARIVVPEYLPEPIRPVPVTFMFSGNEITFGPVDAVVGKGGGKVSGWFRFDQWIPNIFSIDIQVPQETSIPYDLNISGFLANGLASGKLVLSMEDMILSIKGELTAHDTGMSVNADEITLTQESQGAFGAEDQKVSVITDINVRTGRRVEFFWPSVDLPVIQANADMGTGVHITSDSMARRFTLNGDVKLRSGEIFYLERNFYIREGTLFFRENEVEFDPKISARAEIRDQAKIGPVTISMIIDNAPLRSFSPRFVSAPPLSQLEIYSLLGQAPQGGEGTPRNLAMATSAVMDSLTQFAVINRLQRQVRNFLGMDMLSMRTQLLQNVVVQAAGGQFSDNASDRPYRLGNYFDNTTVFIGKYIGTGLFGEAMLSFKYDENKIDWGGLVLAPELGFELRNPLFDIQFNMVPLHLRNLFINDVSFSLVWRWTF
jgi:translocation and assembly module TamB